MTLTPRHCDLLRAGLSANGARIYANDLGMARELEAAGYAEIIDARRLRLHTTLDGVRALSVATTRPPRPHFAGLAAADCNAWLATLPPVPIWGAEP